VVLALINTVFAQETQDAAITQWRTVADQLRAKFPKLAALMDDAESDVLAFMSFPKSHQVQIHSTNPLERLNAEIKRRTNVVVGGSSRQSRRSRTQSDSWRMQ
jgi:putative transposase